MTILEALKQDHNEFKSMLKQIMSAKSASERNELFKEFKTQLIAHSRSEERVFYKRLEKHDDGKMIGLEGEVEHETAERLVDDLSRSRAKDSDRWSARLSVLKEFLEHHIEEEESEAFKTARKLFDAAELAKMAEEFEAGKQRLQQKKAA